MQQELGLNMKNVQEHVVSMYMMHSSIIGMCTHGNQTTRSMSTLYTCWLVQSCVVGCTNHSSPYATTSLTGSYMYASVQYFLEYIAVEVPHQLQHV